MGAQTYHVVLKEDEDGWYAVQCVELPGAISQGRTKEEALANIKDAINYSLSISPTRFVKKRWNRRDL